MFVKENFSSEVNFLPQGSPNELAGIGSFVVGAHHSIESISIILSMRYISA
jgi:hypothetical protein